MANNIFKWGLHERSSPRWIQVAFVVFLGIAILFFALAVFHILMNRLDLRGEESTPVGLDRTVWLAVIALGAAFASGVAETACRGAMYSGFLRQVIYRKSRPGAFWALTIFWSIMPVTILWLAIMHYVATFGGE